MTSVQIRIDLTDEEAGIKYSDKIRYNSDDLLLISHVGPLAEKLYRSIKLKMKEDNKAKEQN